MVIAEDPLVINISTIENKSEKISNEKIKFTTQQDQIIQNEDEPPAEIMHHLNLLGNIRDVNLKQVVRNGEDQFIAISKQDNNFVYIRKSSIIWLLYVNKTRISTDRINRFITQKNVKSLYDQSILFVGEYSVFKIEEETVVGYILGLRYLTGRNEKFSALFCPLIVPENSEERGVEALCELCEINEDFTLLSKQQSKHLNLKNHKFQVNVVFANGIMKKQGNFMEMLSAIV